MSPFAFLELVCLVVLILSASKRGALLALMAGVIYMSQYEALNLLGLNMFAVRLLEVAVLLRVIVRHELSAFKLNGMDRAFLGLYVFSTVVFVLRSRVDLAFQVGTGVDALIIYFSCRALVDSPDDFRWFLRAFIFLLVPFVLLVIAESQTGGSALNFTGWRPGRDFVYMTRNDRIRCIGSFRHPSLLGTISVCFIPLFIGMAFRKDDRKRAALGMALCLAIIWAANSGGPISGTAFGCVAWFCWRWRTKMRYIRWGIIGFIALAALMMKAPVWYLLDHVSAISGGGGWHRSYLLDVSTKNIGKWWLAGMPLADTTSWFAYTLAINNEADITNEFVALGLTAGIGAVALFILLLERAFVALGAALRAVRAASTRPTDGEVLLWSLGCMLAAHIVNQLGITYFDQTHVFWFAQLAAISSLTDWYLKKAPDAVSPTTEQDSSLDIRYDQEMATQ